MRGSQRSFFASPTGSFFEPLIGLCSVMVPADGGGSTQDDQVHRLGDKRDGRPGAHQYTLCGKIGFGGWLGNERAVTCQDCLAGYVVQKLIECSEQDADTHGNEPCPTCVPEDDDA